LKLHPLEGSPWETVKVKDDSGLLDATPYIQIKDEARYPGHAQ
jgi:hypothetical protein